MNREAEQILLKVSTAKKWMVDNLGGFYITSQKYRVVDTTGKVVFPKLSLKDAQAMVSEHNGNIDAMRALMSMGMSHQISIDNLKRKINKLEATQ